MARKTGHDQGDRDRGIHMEARGSSTFKRPVIQDKMVRQIRDVLLDTAGGRIKRVLLYGSRAKGTANADSDYDILVVEEVPGSTRDEASRLRRVLQHLSMPVDVWVMGEEEFQETKDVIGGLAFPAQKYGLDLL